MSGSRILIVDDRSDIILSARFLLEDNGYQVFSADNPYSAKELLAKQQIDLILLDMNYSLDTTSGEEGLAFLSWLQKNQINSAVVAMTAWSNVELAVRAMQLGAGDFLEKPWKNQRLLQVISSQLEMSGLRTQNLKLKQQLKQDSESSYQWYSPCMQQLLSQIESVAPADVSIILTGENGTGKSQLAKAIHNQSMRSAEPFIAVNMGAISESLFESEMFGHKKGAFTDAKENRIGRFELAQNGTLFLDEIANIPLSQQAKLLRVLETGEFETLGSSQTQYSQVRLISATNGDMEAMIESKDFREDLFYRLNTISLRLPALRERTEDLVPLSLFFIQSYCEKYKKPAKTLSLSAEKAIKSYGWPGNIRELSHLLERTVLLSQSDVIEDKDLNLANTKPQTSIAEMTLEEAEKMLIRQALSSTDRNITQAAKLLGITKSSLYRRLEKYHDLQA